MSSSTDDFLKRRAAEAANAARVLYETDQILPTGRERFPVGNRAVKRLKIGQLPISSGRPMFFDFITGEADEVEFPAGLKAGTFDVYVATIVVERELAAFESRVLDAAEGQDDPHATEYPLDEEFDALYVRFNALEPDRWVPVERKSPTSGELTPHMLAVEASWAGLADRATVEAGEALIDATDEEIEEADDGYDPRRPDPYNDEEWEWLQDTTNAIVPYGKGARNRAVVLRSHGDSDLFPVWGMNGSTVCALLACTKMPGVHGCTLLRLKQDGSSVEITNPFPAPAASVPAAPASPTPTPAAAPAPAQAPAAPRTVSPPTPQPLRPTSDARKPWWKRFFGG